jgi:hypothetical protein
MVICSLPEPVVIGTWIEPLGTPEAEKTAVPSEAVRSPALLLNSSALMLEAQVKAPLATAQAPLEDRRVEPAPAVG